MAANRHLALRATGGQAVVALLVALAFLFKDVPAALAAGMGGASVVLGNLLLAWRSFSTQTPSAGLALWGVLVGIGLKWLVVFAALYLALVRFALPPLPLLAGLASTTAAFLIIGKTNQ